MSRRPRVGCSKGKRKKIVYVDYISAFRALVALRKKYKCNYLHDYYCYDCVGWHIGRDPMGREVENCDDLLSTHELQYTYQESG